MMKNVREYLAERRLPELLNYNQKEWVEILAENVYGKMPECIGQTTWCVTEEISNAAGKAVTRIVEITFPTPDGSSFTFPITVTVPRTATAEAKKAAFVYVSFGKPKYYPMEELVDCDVIVAEMVMNDVAFDGEDGYKGLMAAHFYQDGKRTPDGFGKIGMWAFAASRVLDYLLSLDYVDEKHVGVVGHSRLGKTALWAGANDTRFTHVFSNNSGCAGAAITRGKVGEDIPRIYQTFPYWFCENMKQIASSKEASEATEFDQHFLIAAIAPRKVYVASAKEDKWADPMSEYLCCVAASPAWEKYGLKGFVHPDRLPECGDVFMDGSIGYHLREGEHFLSRHDWKQFCRFLKK